MLDILFGFLSYFIPTVAIARILSRNKTLKPIALIVFFGTSLFGEIIFLILSGRHPISVVVDVGFWKTVASYYPMALFPLGLWGALLAMAAIRVLQVKAARHKYSVTFLLVGGPVIGGFIGLIFMSFYTFLTIVIEESSGLQRNFVAPVMSGLTGGVFSGFVCGYFILITQGRDTAAA